MKIVLIPPPHIQHGSSLSTGIVYPPLGILNIATVAQGAGHELIICDLNIARLSGILPSRRKWNESAAEYILSLDPEIVGFGTLCSSFPSSIIIAQEIKKKRPSIPIILGGPQATLVADELLKKFKEIDFILTREADYTFTEFLERIRCENSLSSVEGLVYKANGRIVKNPSNSIVDVDTLPIINNKLWPFQKAIEKKWCYNNIPIDAGRGCPFECYFCSTNRFFLRRFRLKSPDRIIKEMELFYNEYGFHSFKLTHDNFTASKEKVIDFCEAVKNSIIPNLKWSCSSRIDTINSELLSQMRESGCVGIFFGFETGTARMQKVIKKNLNVKTFGPTFRAAIDLGFNFSLSGIVGFPEEQWSDTEATISTLLKFTGIKGVHPQVHMLSPQPGTELMDIYKDCLEFDGWFPDRAYFNTKVPQREQKFVRENPALCSVFYHVPNPIVNHRELGKMVEFTSLLMSNIPGLTPFILRLEKSPIAFICRWADQCVARGLPIPSYNGFFTNTRFSRYPYLELLLDELLKNKAATEEKHAFINYWRTLLLLSYKKSNGRNLSSETLSLSNERIDPEAKPIIVRNHAVIRLNYDVVEVIDRWRNKGQWTRPKKSPVAYFIIKKRDHILITRVPRITSLLLQWCDGKHTINELIALANSLDDEHTSSLRNTTSTENLVILILSIIKKIADLKSVPNN